MALQNAMRHIGGEGIERPLQIQFGKAADLATSIR